MYFFSHLLKRLEHRKGTGCFALGHIRKKPEGYFRNLQGLPFCHRPKDFPGQNHSMKPRGVLNWLTASAQGCPEIPTDKALHNHSFRDASRHRCGCTRQTLMSLKRSFCRWLPPTPQRKVWEARVGSPGGTTCSEAVRVEW